MLKEDCKLQKKIAEIREYIDKEILSDNLKEKEIKACYKLETIVSGIIG